MFSIEPRPLPIKKFGKRKGEYEGEGENISKCFPLPPHIILYLPSFPHKLHPVAGSGTGFEAMQVIIELEDAAGTFSNHDIGTAFDDGTGAGFAKLIGDSRVLQAGYAATATAGAGGGQFDKAYPRLNGELSAQSASHMRIEPEMARIMHGDD